MENHSAVSYKLNTLSALWPNNSTPRYLSKRNANMEPHKHWCECGSPIHNSPGNNPCVHQRRKDKQTCDTFRQRNTTQEEVAYALKVWMNFTNTWNIRSQKEKSAYVWPRLYEVLEQSYYSKVKAVRGCFLEGRWGSEERDTRAHPGVLATFCTLMGAGCSMCSLVSSCWIVC